MTPQDIRWDGQGLAPAVVQDASTGTVLMVAWMNAAALAQTLQGPHTVFWSRSRQSLWVKGETSGNLMRVRSVSADCDADTILVTVDPAGPACHTGAQSCFFEPLTEDPAPSRLGEVLGALARTIESRKGGDPSESWTAKLLAGGPAAYGAKVIEEADEMVRACTDESDGRVAEEAADLLYHLLVALADRDVELTRVAQILAARAGTSGLQAKAMRGHGRDSP